MIFGDQKSPDQGIIPAGLTSRFRRELVVLALDVDQPRDDRQKALGGAFMWTESPQGGPFWFEQQDAIRFGDQPDWDGPIDLTDDAREQLSIWLVQSMVV